MVLCEDLLNAGRFSRHHGMFQVPAEVECSQISDDPTTMSKAALIDFQMFMTVDFRLFLKKYMTEEGDKWACRLWGG
jgi:hypothetical protein